MSPPRKPKELKAQVLVQFRLTMRDAEAARAFAERKGMTLAGMAKSLLVEETNKDLWTQLDRETKA